MKDKFWKKWQFWPKNVITQIFQRPYNLISILAEVHFLFRAVCNICGLDISNPNYLEKHKKVVHDGLYDFSCHHCGKLFSVLPLLRTHLGMNWLYARRHSRPYNRQVFADGAFCEYLSIIWSWTLNQIYRRPN